MSNNPYTPPASALDETAQSPIEIPEEIAKKIKSGWVAGLISSCLTVLFATFAFFGTSIAGINSLALIDAGVVATLSYGVYKRSRVCAVLLFLFFTFSKILMWKKTGALSGLPLALAFFYCFAQGIVGTFQYRKHKNQ